MAKVKKLLFVDTNIWLDFYRARNDASLGLLAHLEAVSSRIIITYQVESEFKRNRQAAMFEGMQELKAPAHIARPAVFSDAKATEVLNKSIKEAQKQVKGLRSRLVRAMDNPGRYDPVYQACQRIFHKSDGLKLTRDNPIRRQIRRRAFRRFLHGCPPRKRDDTSFGDSFNWEWMIECAIADNAELVIVSRDSDYGLTLDGQAYVNDHLKQEFGERVSKKRKLLLYSRLAEGLKHFAVPVTKQEEDAESELVAAGTIRGVLNEGDVVEIVHGPLTGVVGRLLGRGPGGIATVSIKMIDRSVSVALAETDVQRSLL